MSGAGGTGSPSPGEGPPVPTAQPGQGLSGSPPVTSPQGGAPGPIPNQGTGGPSSPSGGGIPPSPGSSNSPGATKSPGTGTPASGSGGVSGSTPVGSPGVTGSPPGENGGGSGTPQSGNGKTPGIKNGSPPPSGSGGVIGSESPPNGSGATGTPGNGSAPGGSAAASPPGPPTAAPGSASGPGGSPTGWPSPPVSTAAGPASAPTAGAADQPSASPGDGTGNRTGAPGPAASAQGPAAGPAESPSDAPGICIGDCIPGSGAQISISGQAFDSYLQSCATFVDLNGNGVQDFGEPSGMTDLFGQFNMSAPGYAPLGLLAGGECTDAATGVLLPGALFAPPGATVITPLTTLVYQLGTRQNLEAVAAEPVVAAAFGLNLSATLTLTSTDVIAAVLADQDADAARVVVENTRAQNVVALAAALLSTGGDRTAAAAVTFGSLADAIWALNGTGPAGTSNGTNMEDASSAQVEAGGSNETSGGSSQGTGQASVQLRSLLGMLSEASPGGSVSNLDISRTLSGLEGSLENECAEGEELPGQSEPRVIGVHVNERKHAFDTEGPALATNLLINEQYRRGRVQEEGSNRRGRVRRLLQSGSGASNVTAQSPANLTDPAFLERALENAYQSLFNVSLENLQTSNDSASAAGAPPLSADDFALAAAAMGVANAAMDAPLEAFLQLNLAGSSNRSTAIDFLNEIWRRAKAAQSGFADVLVQLGAGQVNSSAAAAALSPAAFQNILANTTVTVSSSGGQASLQAQIGAPPPPGVIQLPQGLVGQKHRAPSWVWILVGVAVGVGALLLCCCCGGVAWYCYKKKRHRATNQRSADPEQGALVSPRRWPWSPRAAARESTPPTAAAPDAASPLESPPVSPGAILRSHSIALPPNTHLLAVAAQAETARETPPGGEETPQETAFSTPRSGISSDSDSVDSGE